MDLDHLQPPYISLKSGGEISSSEDICCFPFPTPSFTFVVYNLSTLYWSFTIIVLGIFLRGAIMGKNLNRFVLSAHYATIFFDDNKGS